MTQYSFPTIDPNTKSGTGLSTDLNGLWPALISTHRGASRPSYAVAGMCWVKIVSATAEEIYYFDGTDDIRIGTVNPTANTFTPAGITSTIPVGLGPLPWPGTAAPSKWILAYGQAISRTTYAALFAVLGTTFGAGDGSTTFNMPDWRGRFSAFKDDMGGSAAGRLTATVMSPNGNTIGATGGSQTHTLSTAELASHTHNVPIPGVSGGSSRDTAASSGNFQATTSAGSGSAHNNTPPCMIHNAIYYADV